MNRTRVDSVIASALTWSVALIIVLVPFHAFFTTWVGSNLGHLDGWRIWDAIIITIATPLAIYKAIKVESIKSWLKRSWVLRLFIGYILLHIILGIFAIRNNRVNQSAFIYSLIVNLRFIAFFLIALIAAESAPWLKKKWHQLVLIPASVVMAFGLLQIFLLPYDFLKHFGYGKNTIASYQTVDASINYRRIQSTLRGANPLGAYMVLIIPTLLLVLKRQPWIQIFSVAGAGLVLFFSYSRSAWIGAALTLILLTFKVANSKLRSLLLVIGIGLTVLLSVLIILFRGNANLQDTFFHTSKSSASAQSSNSVRAQAMLNGLRDIKKQPLGGGPGTAGPASQRNNHPSRISENYFLQLGQEVGVLGVLIFVAINLLVIKGLWENHRDSLSLILLTSWVGITLVNLLSHEWTDDTLSLLWWGLAGIALSPVILKKNKRYEKISL